MEFFTQFKLIWKNDNITNVAKKEQLLHNDTETLEESAENMVKGKVFRKSVFNICLLSSAWRFKHVL